MSGRGRGDLFGNKWQIQREHTAPPAPPTDITPPAERPPDQKPIGRGRGALLSSFSSTPVEGSSSIETKSSAISHEPPKPSISSPPTGLQECGSTRGFRPSRASSLQMSEIAHSMDRLSVSETSTTEDVSDPPAVIMQGTSGSNIDVTCNYIRLSVMEGRGIFQYDVKFKPDVDSRNMRFHLMKQVANVIGDTKSFDGAQLFLPKQLDKQVTYLKATMPSDQSEVKLKVTLVKAIRMGHPLAIQMYNVLFRRVMNILGYTLHGKHFFDPSGAKLIPEHKLEVWPGFVTAIQNFEGGVMLCCDASHRVLRVDTVHSLMMDLASLARSPNSWQEEFANLVIGQVVLTRYNNKVYRIDDIDFDSSPKSTFTMKSNEQVSYMDYYKRAYNIDITDAGQPLLKSRVKAKVKGQEVSQLVDLVPELCYLSGITDSMRADFKVMKAIAQYTRVGPAQRQLALNRFLMNIHGNKEVCQLFDSWGISLSKANVNFSTRVVPAENLYFGKGTSYAGNFQCDWTRGITNNPVMSAIDFNTWAIVCTKRDERVVEDFVKMCRTVGPKMGIEIRNPIVHTLANDNTHSYIAQLQKLKGQSVQIVVVLLPIARADKYAAVKKHCCIDNAIPSQVIITRTIRFPDKLRSVVQKIVLQMNCKLGGTLWAVKIPVKSAIVIGIDTFHCGNNKNASFAAVVASLNPQFTRWYSKICKQGVGIELVEGLASCIVKCLIKYKSVNDSLPEQILVYRDGVGDGQIDCCVDYEVPQMIAACSRLAPNYQPKLLYVIVQKNTSTRIYANESGGMSNPPPGTIVDSLVTRRNVFDFFLVSQSVKQGTVSPSHYIVAHNSTSMDPDKIQRFSYKLTHLYYNWCGTVRVPAPCQYAHKLASLVGDSINKEADESLADKLYYL